MADPRLYQTFKCQAAAASQQSQLRSFGNAVGKIGDLQVLNSVGGGAVGQGLRTLASISNTIRTGCGSLPTSIGTSIESGANWVLEHTGIAPTVVQAVSNFNPGIANQAYGQAKNVYAMVKAGHFKTTDIPGALQDLQNLERLGRNIFTPDTVQGGISVDCTTSPYAMDLIARAPKHKFLFVVQVIFNSGYSSLDQLDFTFVVKKSTRPNVKYQMEDVNYYNFRSKIITKTEMDEMSMTFHDDMTNQVVRFVEAYRRAISPLANMGPNTFFTNPENSGMDFTDDYGSNVLSDKNPIEDSILSGHYTATRGALAEDNVGVIRTIKLFHVYDGGRLANIYQFFNPRISQINYDEVDMSANDANEVTINFNYDSVYVSTDVSVQDIATVDGIPGQGRGAVYPLRYNDTAAAMDASHKPTTSPSGVGATTSCDPIGGTNTSNNPLVAGGGIGGAIASAARQATGSAGDIISNLLS